MSKNCFVTNDPNKDHRRFWNPTIDTYWINKNIEENHSGFPCLIIFLYKSVNQGEQGDEDPSHILDNIIYQYPNNIPNRLIQALLGGLVSFITFSRLNLNSLLKSFSWNHSTISINSIPLNDGNFLIFALKMPTMFTEFSIKSSINKLVLSLKMINFKLNNLLNINEIIELKNFFFENSKFIELITFPLKIDDPFEYSSRCFPSNASKSVTCLATELFTFIKEISNNVIGSAIFYKTDLILSEIQNPLLNLLPIFNILSLQLIDHQSSKFDSFDLWINFKEFNWSNENELIPLSLNIISWGSLFYFVLIKKDLNILNILKNINDLLLNGISDFCVECDSMIKEKLEGIPSIVYSPDISCIKQTFCDISTLQRITCIHDQFIEYPNLKELSILNNGKYICGLSLPKLQVFCEIKNENLSKPFILEVYSKVKEIVPNLSSDLMNL